MGIFTSSNNHELQDELALQEEAKDMLTMPRRTRIFAGAIETGLYGIVGYLAPLKLLALLAVSGPAVWGIAAVFCVVYLILTAVNHYKQYGIEQEKTDRLYKALDKFQNQITEKYVDRLENFFEAIPAADILDSEAEAAESMALESADEKMTNSQEASLSKPERNKQRIKELISLQQNIKDKKVLYLLRARQELLVAETDDEEEIKKVEAKKAEIQKTIDCAVRLEELAMKYHQKPFIARDDDYEQNKDKEKYWHKFIPRYFADWKRTFTSIPSGASLAIGLTLAVLGTAALFTGPHGVAIAVGIMLAGVVVGLTVQYLVNIRQSRRMQQVGGAAMGIDTYIEGKAIRLKNGVKAQLIKQETQTISIKYSKTTEEVTRLYSELLPALNTYDSSVPEMVGHFRLDTPTGDGPSIPDESYLVASDSEQGNSSMLLQAEGNDSLQENFSTLVLPKKLMAITSRDRSESDLSYLHEIVNTTQLENQKPIPNPFSFFKVAPSPATLATANDETIVVLREISDQISAGVVVEKKAPGNTRR